MEEIKRFGNNLEAVRSMSLTDNAGILLIRGEGGRSTRKNRHVRAFFEKLQPSSNKNTGILTLIRAIRIFLWVSTKRVPLEAVGNSIQRYLVDKRWENGHNGMSSIARIIFS